MARVAALSLTNHGPCMSRALSLPIRSVLYYVILLFLTVRDGGSLFFVPLGHRLRADVLCSRSEID